MWNQCCTDQQTAEPEPSHQHAVSQPTPNLRHRQAAHSGLQRAEPQSLGLELRTTQPSENSFTRTLDGPGNPVQADSISPSSPAPCPTFLSASLASVVLFSASLWQPKLPKYYTYSFSALHKPCPMPRLPSLLIPSYQSHCS